MPSSFDIHILAITIAAPGMFILAWASLSVLAWVYRREATLPFERKCSDQIRLVRTGLDLTYGLLPVGISWFVEGYSLIGVTHISQTIYWSAFAATVAYPILYYRFLRPSLTSMRVALRNREQAQRPEA